MSSEVLTRYTTDENRILIASEGVAGKTDSEKGDIFQYSNPEWIARNDLGTLDGITKADIEEIIVTDKPISVNGSENDLAIFTEDLPDGFTNSGNSGQQIISKGNVWSSDGSLWTSRGTLTDITDISTLSEITAGNVFPSSGKYKSQRNSVRRLASPNAAVPLTESQLPNDFIDDPAYLNAEERFVLRKLKKKTSTFNIETDEDSEQIIFLVQLRIAIRLIPQLPLILRQTMVGETVAIQEFDLEERLKELEDIYIEETEDITPDADSGKIKIKALATDKKMWPPSTNYEIFGSE